jgi:hypothetical protein
MIELHAYLRDLFTEDGRAIGALPTPTPIELAIAIQVAAVEASLTGDRGAHAEVMTLVAALYA